MPAFDVQAVVLSRRNFNWFSTFPPVFQLEEELRDKRPSNLNISVAQSALSSIVYTSGSTGKPRGIMLSHRNIVSNTHSIIQALHLTEKDIQMVVLPFSYVMGKSLLNTHFAVGGTVIINNKFAFSGSMIKQMSEEGVTGFSGVPSTYAYLLHRSPLASYQDRLGSLRYCSQAGGHMSRHVKEKLRRVLPKHTHIYIMYGTTEASARLTCLDPSQFINNLDSVGKPIPDVKMFVMDKAGHGVAPGEIGEIVATGPNIMMGYWNDEEATKSVMDQAGYHTGDLGYRDSEGYYFIVGRKDNQVKIGGHRINTQEIEKVLIELEQVTEAAVLGIPDELLGQKLIAVIAPKNTDCDEKMILNLCAMKLPRYQIPAHIKLVRTLPKTSSGKVDKAKCLDLAKL